VSDQDVIYSESYYGYSARHHVSGKRLVRYLALILSSQVALWLALILSGKFGFEREVVEKSTIDEIGLPPFESLDAASVRKATELFDLVAREPNEVSWARVDEWVASLYGFSKRDLETISDTLSYNLPFSENRRRAQSTVGRRELNHFAKVLSTELAPWARRYDRKISVSVETATGSAPWRFLRIVSEGSDGGSIAEPDWAKLIGLADELAATEIVFSDEAKDCLWLARLAQERY
jgi:hypothetical protein